MRWLLTLGLCLLVTQASAEPLRILSLGDSYTIGESVRPEARWPNLLADELNQAGLAVEAPTIFATTGWTSGNLRARLNQALRNNPDFPHDADWVTLMIGVNDQYQGRSIAEFEANLAQLLEQAATLNGQRFRRILVLSIPDWSVSRFGRSRQSLVQPEIAAFNRAAKRLVEKQAAVWIEIGDLVELARNDDDYLADDGLHFSARMHRLWAQRVTQQVLSAQAEEAGYPNSHAIIETMPTGD